jgi:hypothetical protein
VADLAAILEKAWCEARVSHMLQTISEHFCGFRMAAEKSEKWTPRIKPGVTVRPAHGFRQGPHAA